MLREPTVIERAFALARSGEVTDLRDLHRQLQQEEFSSIDPHVGGATPRKQLVELIQVPTSGTASELPAPSA